MHVQIEISWNGDRCSSSRLFGIFKRGQGRPGLFKILLLDTDKCPARRYTFTGQERAEAAVMYVRISCVSPYKTDVPGRVVSVLLRDTSLGKGGLAPALPTHCTLSTTNTTHLHHLNHRHPTRVTRLPRHIAVQIPQFNCHHSIHQHVLQRAHEHGANHAAQSARTASKRARCFYDLGMRANRAGVNYTANRHSPTMKSQVASRTLASSSQSRTYRSRTLRSFKRSSNG